MEIQDYNRVNALKDTKTVTLGNDVYTLEIRETSYHVLINNREDKVYTRLPKELREWFGA